HRFPVAQARRDHLENVIRNDPLDADCRTEERGRPYTLICTKNTKSYQASVRKYHQDQEHLALVLAIEEGLPGGGRRRRQGGRLRLRRAAWSQTPPPGRIRRGWVGAGSRRGGPCRCVRCVRIVAPRVWWRRSTSAGRCAAPAARARSASGPSSPPR